MQAPAALLSVLLASIYGLAYALLIGKTGHRLWWYAGFSLIGFFGGFLLAMHHHLTMYGVGQIPIFECSLGSLALLLVATILRR